MKQLGYYAKDKDNNLFQFEWGADNEFTILNSDGDYVMANPKDYDIVEIGYTTSDTPTKSEPPISLDSQKERNKYAQGSEYKFVNDFGNNVTCSRFTNTNWGGIAISVEGKRLGSMVGETLPDRDDEQDVIDFESRVTDWIVENE